MNNHRLSHYVYSRRNLYAGEPTATLPLEAARLTDNRRLIAADLRRDPGSWHGGRNNIAVCDVLLGDCLGELLRRPALTGGAA